MTIKLSDKTVLAALSVSRWSGHRFDRSATQQVHEANEADRHAGNYNKRLLPMGATTDINSAVNLARAFHLTKTLPWLDDGVRILPASSYMEYASAMKGFRQQFDKEVSDFIEEYPKLKKQAQTKLGRLYKEADYPSVAEIKKFYKWDLTIRPFPDAADFRVSGMSLEDADVAQMKADLEKRMEQVWADAMSDIGQRVVDVVGRMKERLKAYNPGKPGKRAEGTFKDSLVENVRELAGILPSFNLGNDPKLAKIIAQMQKDLCKHDTDELREDVKVRQKVAASADAVLAAISDFIA